MKRSNRAGFTLVEVLTVIAIIALLASLILGLAGNAQKTAARKKAEAEINQIQGFITDYQMQYGRVPSEKADLAVALTDAKHSLSNMVDPWGMDYNYRTSSFVTYYLWSQGGDLGGANRDMWIGNPMP
ncbi:MAG: type II secretion system protein [Kiritimatiellia bacterium]